MPSPEPIPGRCGARISDVETGDVLGYCENHPMKFQARCYKHGGASPQAKRAALERRVEHEASAWLSKQNIAPLKDKYGTLQRIHAENVALYDYLKGRVQDLAASDQLTLVTASQGEQVRGLMAAFERAADRVHRMITDTLKIDLDARLVKHDEARLALTLEKVAAEFDAVMHDPELALTPAQDARARLLIRERLCRNQPQLGA